MAISVADPVSLARYMTLGFQRLRHRIDLRLRLLREYAGRLYWNNSELRSLIADRGSMMPVNLMHQATTTMVPNLVYESPACNIGTRYLQYKPYAETLAMATTHLSDEIDLRMTLRMAITDAIFMAGFIKTGIGTSSQTLDIDGILMDPGQPYASRVDPGDMLLDPLGREWHEQKIIGNRFRMSKEALLASGLYDADKIEKLSSRYSYSGGNDAALLSGARSTVSEADELAGMIDLVEVWLPDDNAIAVLPWQPDNTVAPDVLRVVDYEGPERGPYHILGFAFVPDNILPVAPASIWYDLHMLTNQVARKLVEQAERQKNVLAYEGSAWQDAQEIADAIDGETVRVDNINAIKEVSYGGTNDANYQYVEWAQNKFSEMSMNIELLSGSGANEATATQSEMVQANTGVRLGDMTGIVYLFAGDVMKDLAFFLHTDPLIELPMVKRTRGVDEQVVYSAEMQEGDWMDYVLKVRPQSMARQDPNVEVRRLLQFFGNVIPAIAQAQQMLGPAFNAEAALSIVGQKMGIEELGEIINSEALKKQLDVLLAAIESGAPMNAALAQAAGFGGGMKAGGEGGRPGQPNPSQMMPDSLPDEQAQGFQETAGELQAAYPSAGQPRPGEQAF